MSLKYLQITAPSTVLVDSSLRDWTDYDTQRHVDYHVAVFSLLEGKFDVVVNAGSTPFSAIFHLEFFSELCRVLRGPFKGRLGVCTIKNAPRMVHAGHAALSALGLIGTDTAGKIVFECDTA